MVLCREHESGGAGGTGLWARCSHAECARSSEPGRVRDPHRRRLVCAPSAAARATSGPAAEEPKERIRARHLLRPRPPALYAFLLRGGPVLKLCGVCVRARRGRMTSWVPLEKGPFQTTRDAHLKGLSRMLTRCHERDGKRRRENPGDRCIVINQERSDPLSGKAYIQQFFFQVTLFTTV